MSFLREIHLNTGYGVDVSAGRRSWGAPSTVAVLEIAAKSEYEDDGQYKGIVFHPGIMAGS